MNSKLKMFVRYDNNGRIVSGSNIFAMQKPKIGKWQEITPSSYCTSTTSTTTTLFPTTLSFGLLYNWYAGLDSRNLSNAGWTIPTQANFQTLTTYCGSNPTIKLVEEGSAYWSLPGINTNEFLFNTRGSGKRTVIFQYLKSAASWLTLTTSYYGPTSYYHADIVNNSPSHTISYNSDNNNKWQGMAVRFIKISPTADDLSKLDGQACDPYIGNDGKYYRTVKIGTQVWLADNLQETKYRNGDDIPEVTNQTTWNSLITGALCAYNNDWNNV